MEIIIIKSNCYYFHKTKNYLIISNTKNGKWHAVSGICKLVVKFKKNLHRMYFMNAKFNESIKL